MLFDTHIHLDCLGPREEMVADVAAARDVGVDYFLVPGVRSSAWGAIRETVDLVEGGLAAYGLHPLAAGEWSETCRDLLCRYLQDEKAVAVGEIGLDRYVDWPVSMQEEVFRHQLQIAAQFGKPVLLHCRKMPGRIVEILQSEEGARIEGIMHAFSGSWETAKAALDCGFLLSFGGPLTYPEARRAIEVLQRLPDDAIVIETDAPDLPPHPHRGERNRPAWLPLVLQKVAEVRGWEWQQAAEITTKNARRILKLDDKDG